MLTIGKHEAEILDHTIREIGDKDAVSLQCQIGDEITEVLIWLTEKSMGIARRQLDLCGFDVDTNFLTRLIAEPTLLAGKRISVIVEEYKGKLRAAILLDPTPSKKRLAEMTAQLRAAKKTEEEEGLPF